MISTDPVRPHIDRMLMEIQLEAEGRGDECLPVMESYELAMAAIDAQKSSAPPPPLAIWRRFLRWIDGY